MVILKKYLNKKRNGLGQKDEKMNNDYHIHTNVTDGESSPEEIVNIARQLKIATIAFTEHISRNPTYDWIEFRRRIKDLNSEGIGVLIGVETKVLDSAGTLNVSDEILDKADVVLGSVHGIGRVEWLLKSECDIIAHPQINNENVKLFENCNYVLEINSKYRLPFEILDRLILNTGNVFSFGSDAHSIQDLVNAQEYFKSILKRYPKINLFC